MIYLNTDCESSVRNVDRENNVVVITVRLLLFKIYEGGKFRDFSSRISKMFTTFTEPQILTV